MVNTSRSLGGAVPAELRSLNFDSTNGSLRGTGGWLALCIFTLIVSVPAAHVLYFVNSYQHSLEVILRSHHRYSLLAFYFVEQLANFGVRGYGIYAGIQLWKVRQGAIEKAKRFLLGLMLIALLDYVTGIVWIFLMEPSRSLVADKVLTFVRGRNSMAVLQTAFYVAIWYTYLLKSERVRVTFLMDDNLKREPTQPDLS
jgi:Protein of unknown function (DUF2569)